MATLEAGTYTLDGLAKSPSNLSGEDTKENGISCSLSRVANGLRRRRECKSQDKPHNNLADLGLLNPYNAFAVDAVI